MATPAITGNAPLASGGSSSGFVGSPLTTSSFAVTAGKSYLFIAHAALWTGTDTFGSTLSGSTLSWSAAMAQVKSNASPNWSMAAWVATAGSSNGAETITITETSTGAWHFIWWSVYEITNYGGLGATASRNDSSGANPTGGITPTTVGSVIFAAAIADVGQPVAPTGFTALNLAGASTNYASDTLSSVTTSTTPLSYVFTATNQNEWASLSIEILPTGGGGSTINVSLAESGTASDTLSASLTASAVISEGGTASDTLGGGLLLSAALSEVGTAVDALSSQITAAAALTETGAASDTLASQLTAVGALVEIGTASFALSGALNMSATFVETGALSDTMVGGLLVSVSMSEAGSLSDILSATLIASAALAENGAATDALAATLSMHAQLNETLVGVDALLATMQISVALAEALNASFSLTASGASPSFVGAPMILRKASVSLTLQKIDAAMMLRKVDGTMLLRKGGVA